MTAKEWLACKPLADANLEAWVNSILADGIKIASDQLNDSEEYYRITAASPEIAQTLRTEIRLLNEKAKQLSPRPAAEVKVWPRR